MTETCCPLCGVPRPRGAARCVCNYTFAYEAAPAARGRTRGTTTVAVVAVAVLAAVVTWLAAGDLGTPRGPAGVVLIPAGLFASGAAVVDAWWFFGSRRARLVTAVLGRTGARIFYAVVGGVLIGIGARIA